MLDGGCKQRPGDRARLYVRPLREPTQLDRMLVVEQQLDAVRPNVGHAPTCPDLHILCTKAQVDHGNRQGACGNCGRHAQDIPST